MHDDDENDNGLFKVETIPPPAGSSDAYSAPTKVGPMTSALVEEMMRAAKTKADERKQALAAARPPRPAAPQMTLSPSRASRVDPRVEIDSVPPPSPPVLSPAVLAEAVPVPVPVPVLSRPDTAPIPISVAPPPIAAPPIAAPPTAAPPVAAAPVAALAFAPAPAFSPPVHVATKRRSPIRLVGTVMALMIIASALALYVLVVRGWIRPH